MWRSLSQYLGGAGFALIMMSVLSGTSATSVYHVEGHPHEIFPNVKKSASIIFKIYLLYLVIGSAALTVAGMPLFDSVNHTMCGLGTGGFSTKNASIGFYNSIPINILCILIMYAGSTSFTTHNFLLKGKFNIVFRNIEFRTSIVVIGLITVLTCFLALLPVYGDLGKALMVSAFETVSSVSGSGFTITDYKLWPAIGIFLNIIAMCTGGQTNSTSGALKQLRVAIIFKSIWWAIKQQFLPRNVVDTHYVYKGEEKTFIEPKHIQEVFIFAGIYVISLLLGSGVLMAMGVPMQSAFFEFSSAQGCVGQSIGVTSPTAPSGILLTLMYGMFFGRLEFLVIFYAVIKVFKDIGVLMSKES
jgi:trk system potassium uptake protein TrkH